MNKINIYGAGISGMTVAIYLKKRNPKLDITLYEANDRVGQKILKTGNGKCNLSNTDLDNASNYNNPSFMKEVLKITNSNDLRAFVLDDLGIVLREDDYGRFLEGITTQTDGIVRSHSKTVSTPYVVNIILRNFGGKYLLKLSAIKSANPEKYITGIRIYEKEGYYSYIPPEGWQVQANNFSKFKAAYGPRLNNFSPNISFGQETDSRKLEKYVDDNIQYLDKMSKNAAIIIEFPTNFVTNEGVQGYRITYILNSNETNVRVRQYYFQHGSRKTIATCVALSDSNYDAVFDESIKTVSFER